jgi:hypothetical protein
MKMTKADITALSEIVAKYDTPERRLKFLEAYYAAKLGWVQDVNKRYRWDLIALAYGEAGAVISCYNDDHIDTALRRIVPKLKLEKV